MFIVASLMAFSTGTSWGSFGILLPIAGSVAATIDLNLMIPVMAAVLSGAIFGDHAYPSQIQPYCLQLVQDATLALISTLSFHTRYYLRRRTIAANRYLKQTFGFRKL